MTATTTDRNTKARSGRQRVFGLAAAAVIPAGVIACLNAAGELVNGATSTTLKCVGVSMGNYNNATGAAGAVKGEVQNGVYGPFANSASTDLIALADVGSTCFIVDNQTVAKTNGTSTRSAAGVVFDVDTDGVWVSFS
ncbi:conserved hypothetical protein [Leptothrix cholodnii SP-6]|uniref:Uncharacterized protein n=1 Tax=Leptothrix cholodnii (strain ATCC 51168 / LMG 8142 / SP-6) TaxID=395495 RepID=B1Y3I2_LEPCP|nr:hypothetical protein [Leptothrix cholodnii]ACB34510.1 conserved hypothetical protein [Leptothrix cholodnii SP-6]